MAEVQTLPESFRAAFHDGEAVLREIEETAIKLSALLAQAHGGRWSIDINHRSCFVLVVGKIEGGVDG